MFPFAFWGETISVIYPIAYKVYFIFYGEYYAFLVIYKIMKWNSRHKHINTLHCLWVRHSSFNVISSFCGWCLISLYVHMYTNRYGWMDGWMDGLSFDIVITLHMILCYSIPKLNKYCLKYYFKRSAWSILDQQTVTNSIPLRNEKHSINLAAVEINPI